MFRNVAAKVKGTFSTFTGNPLMAIVYYLQSKQDESNFQERLTHFGVVIECLAKNRSLRTLTGFGINRYVELNWAGQLTHTEGSRERYKGLLDDLYGQLPEVKANFQAFVDKLNLPQYDTDPVISALRAHITPPNKNGKRLLLLLCLITFSARFWPRRSRTQVGF